MFVADKIIVAVEGDSPQPEKIKTISKAKKTWIYFGDIVFAFILFCQPPNGLRYLRWGGDGEAVQPEKR